MNERRKKYIHAQVHSNAQQSASGYLLDVLYGLLALVGEVHVQSEKPQQ